VSKGIDGIDRNERASEKEEEYETRNGERAEGEEREH
jgi:hypothetical protein